MAEPTLRQLRYLSALADTLHFGDAAADCGVSQPALSAQIQELERILGRKLVERTSRKVLLTGEGRAVLTHARRVLQEYDELLALPSGTDPMTGRVRLGIIPTLAPYVLPRVLPTVRSSFPNLELLLVEELTSRLTTQLLEGDLDLILVALPLDSPQLTTTALADESFLLVAPSDHPLSVQKSVAPSDVDPQELLLLQEGHCLRSHALDFCQLDARGHRSAVEGTSLTTLVQMVAGGLGVTLLPVTATVDTSLTDGVCVKPFDGDPPGRTLGMAWRSTTTRTETFEALTGVVRSELDVMLASVTPGGT